MIDINKIVNIVTKSYLLRPKLIMCNCVCTEKNVAPLFKISIDSRLDKFHLNTYIKINKTPREFVII